MNMRISVPVGFVSPKPGDTYLYINEVISKKRLTFLAYKSYEAVVICAEIVPCLGAIVSLSIVCERDKNSTGETGGSDRWIGREKLNWWYF